MQVSGIGSSNLKFIDEVMYRYVSTSNEEKEGEEEYFELQDTMNNLTELNLQAI